MSKKTCELCSNPARMFCESDQASLCWDCDAKVHAANFLVAKHSRTLLCHLCSSPTPWKAAGSSLGATISVCQACAQHGENRVSPSSIPPPRREIEDREEDCDSQESESDDDYSHSEDYSEDDEEEEDGENQVVPWSASSSSPPVNAPESPSSSSTEEDASFSSLKRMRRDNLSFESEDEDGYYSSPDLEVEGNFRSSGTSHEDSSSSSMSLFRPLKLQRISNDGALPAVGRHAPPESSSGTAAIIDKLRRFHRELAN